LDYINFAKKRFKNKGEFIHGYVSENLIKEPKTFDIAIVIGILHHLSDNEALSLFINAKKYLKNGGEIITVDGCYTEKQSQITKYLLKNDRGKFVRNLDGYLNLAKQCFKEVDFKISEDLLNITYTHYNAVKELI
jgi:cyclopropane fatty-acyl-phospholipid synthase-like methyltransferase